MNEMSWRKQKIGLISIQQLYFKSEKGHSHFVPYPSCNVSSQCLQDLQAAHAVYVALPGSNPHVHRGQTVLLRGELKSDRSGPTLPPALLRYNQFTQWHSVDGTVQGLELDSCPAKG